MQTSHHNDTWRILIVDDDPEVHEVTRLSLGGARIQGRLLTLLHAESAAAAYQLLSSEADIAVVLLDVVMEHDDAGLQLVKIIRDELQLHDLRIILRTGQPGYAPEEQVIRDYDINDYKTKQELTHTQLMTTIIASVRSYEQLRTINQHRQGLQKIIAGSSNLMEDQSLQAFADGVITQISSLLGLCAEGMLCATTRNDSDQIDIGDAAGDVYILGAAGQYAWLNSRPLNELPDARCQTLIRQCLNDKQHLQLADETVLYFGREQYSAAIYLQTARSADTADNELIELFLNNISIAYQNVTLFQKLRRAAYADPLTRLANRNEFIRQLHNRTYAPDFQPVVVLLDLKNFSEINDGLGQDIGDELLRAVGERLLSTFSEDTSIARIDADVFGLIGDERALNPVSVLAAFDTPFQSGDQTLLISATLGIGHLKLLGESGMTRLKRAYIALNTAKRNLLGNYAYYVPKMEEDTQQRLVISRALRDALQDKALQVWYQPQFDLNSGIITGVEALLRWPQPDGDFIPPNVFIPIAEHSGAIVEIGSWVITQVSRDLSQLAHDGFAPLRAAINISMPQFRSPCFIADIVQALESCDLHPSQLELEITESVLMDEPDVVIKALLQLKQLGVTISIDDFGTGFSSLNYLRQLPLDRMKVDRSFVRDIDQPGGHLIIESILNLGQQLGLRTIAEGIETSEQEDFVRDHGCDEGQGFLYAQAMPYQALKKFIASQAQRRTAPLATTSSPENDFI